MKKKNKLIAAAIALAFLNCSSLLAQDGMDRKGISGAMYSGLINTPVGAPTGANGWERALGVYQSPITPVSYLEVNTTPAYMPNPMSGLPLDQVFSTNSGGLGSFWNMRRMGIRYGMFFNTLNNNFNMEATRGELWFRTNTTPGADVCRNRMIIDDAGTNGSVVMGDNIGSGGFVPRSRLHLAVLNPVSQRSDLRFTNFNSLHAATDGFQIELDQTALIARLLMLEPTGDMRFLTGGPVGAGGFDRIKIDNPANFSRVVMGDDIGAMTPQSRLHLAMNDPISQPVDLRFTNTSSFHTLNDGFRIGITPAADIARLAMLETFADMRFFTGGPVGGGGFDRMRILDNGRTLIADDASLPPAPGNRLEVRSLVGTDPQDAGLRFTNLTSAHATMPNPGLGVLAVDALGDVIYVPSGGAGLGPALCPSPFPMPGDMGYNCSGSNFWFEGQGPMGTNALVLGLLCGTPLNAKLQVVQRFNSTTAQSRAIAAVNLDNSTTLGQTMYGIQASSSAADGLAGANQPIHTGGSFNASGGWINRAGEFFSTSPATGGVNYGIQTTAASSGVVPSYGIYAENLGGTGAYVNNQWAGWFQGDVNVTGIGVITGGAWISSDRKFKANIKKLESTNEKLNRLSGYTYNFKCDEFKEMNFPKAEQIGLIAQELKEVFPQLVMENSKGELAVNYQGMVPVLLEALKEQNSRINKLESLLQTTANTDMKGKQNPNSQSVALSDKNTIVLNQNVPNPFAESTVIDYNIPSDFTKAQLIFSTVEGRVIKVVDITAKGQGVLNVFADDLSSGIYSYSLVVDGKSIDTKKMIKQ